MDHYADDLAALIETLDLHDAVLVGHSTVLLGRRNEVLLSDFGIALLTQSSHYPTGCATRCKGEENRPHWLVQSSRFLAGAGRIFLSIKHT